MPTAHKLMQIGFGVIISFIVVAINTSCIRGPYDGDSMLHIRIRNASQFDFDNLWLGTGYEFRGSVTEFGAVPAGKTTEYLEIRRHERNYDSLRVLIVDEHFQSDVAATDLATMASSETKRYTYEVQIIGDRQAFISVIPDD